jgi:hypothetical protein
MFYFHELFNVLIFFSSLNSTLCLTETNHRTEIRSLYIVWKPCKMCWFF